MTLAANNKKSKLNKKKTFQVPEVLQEWYVLMLSSGLPGRWDPCNKSSSATKFADTPILHTY